MINKHIPTPELLCKLLRYEPENGKLFWRARTGSVWPEGQSIITDGMAKNFNSVWSGKEAFTSSLPTGHKRGSIFSKYYLAHRVIWAMETGAWPANVIDHINGITFDNRLENMRDVTVATNCKNAKRSSTNTSGYTGVSWDAANAKWQTSIKVNGVGINLGRFAKIEDAVVSRLEANNIHGFHKNHGRNHDGSPKINEGE